MTDDELRLGYHCLDLAIRRYRRRLRRVIGEARQFHSLWQSAAYTAHLRGLQRDRYKAQRDRLYAAWVRAESNRGCYSCCEAHDGRCLKDRGIGECTCGRDDLEAIVAEIDAESAASRTYSGN